MSNYFSVHVISGHEQKVKSALLNRAVAYKAWQETIFDILIPTEKTYETRGNKRKIVDKKVMPGYVFIKMYLDQDTERIVQGTDSVLGFVKSGNKPVPMDDHDIQKIIKHLENAEDDTPKSNFKVNEIVEIVSGPFADFSAKVESVDEIKARVKALINIFGRDTSVELDMQDIRPQK